jgi:hypothetical protein
VSPATALSPAQQSAADPTAPASPDMIPTLVVLPWHDAVVERVGHAADSAYVELFWLGILGPTATWLIRRLNAGLVEYPAGYEIDLPDTARSLGIAYSSLPTNAFTKALHRCVMFGLAQHLGTSGSTVAVRRRLPPLSRRHLSRLPESLQSAHAAWVSG